MRGKGSSLLQITRLHQFTENNGCMSFYCNSRFDCRTYTNLMWMCSSGGTDTCLQVLEIQCTSSLFVCKYVS